MLKPDVAPSAAAAPPPCPFCRCATVTTTTKLVTRTTYWRCQRCGEIWNPARLMGARPAPRW